MPGRCLVDGVSVASPEAAGGGNAMALSERGDAARVDGELRRRLPRTARDIERDSWLVVIVLLTLVLVVPSVGGTWFHHHQWVKHHPAWSYDDYRHGYAAGLGLPAGTSSLPCQRAEKPEYPDSVRREARRQPRSRVGIEVAMFYLGCQDRTLGVPSDPKARVTAATMSDD
jgi:hypothetical protein